jgi:hypothetical protein
MVSNLEGSMVTFAQGFTCRQARMPLGSRKLRKFRTKDSKTFLYLCLHPSHHSQRSNLDEYL